MTFTTVGGTGGPTVRTIDFRQEGALPTITVSTGVPDITMIPAAPTGGTGTITATIALGGGAEGWTATKSDDDSDAFISSFLPASGDATELSLAITYSTNTGVKRTATITLTTVGGTGSPATTDLVITQLGAAPTIDVTTSPSDLTMIPADPGGATGTITATITLGGGADGLDGERRATMIAMRLLRVFCQRAEMRRN